MRYLKIPMERVGVLVGHNGETKRKLEQKTKVTLNIDSQLGEISVDEHSTEDPLLVLKVESMVLAIGRGFSPEHAFMLLSDDFEFFVFDIHDYVGKGKSHVRRLKSRIIGREGKTKRVLEELTDSYLSVYGHTIAVIANIADIDIIKRAVDKLLSGSKHATVYSFVESNMKKLKMDGSF